MDWLKRFLKIGEYSLNRLGGAARSSQWPETKKRFALIHPKKCAILNCKSKQVQLHHRRPFHANPELENDFKNLIWLCEGLLTKNHHLKIGHLEDFKSYNDDLDDWIYKISNRPYWNGKEWINCIKN
jgi:5-methylcytosine-specific restriction enzyme A